MSEGIGVKVSISPEQHTLLTTPAVEAAIESEIQIDSERGSVAATTDDGVPVLGHGGIYAHVGNYSSSLAKSLTSKNVTATLLELNRISTTAGKKGTRQSLVHFLSQLFVTFSTVALSNKQDRAPETTAHQVALASLLDTVSNSQDLPTTICTALQIALERLGHVEVASKKEEEEHCLIELLEYLCTNVLEHVGIVTLTTAVCCGWHTPNSSKVLNYAGKVLFHELKETSELSSLNYFLRQFISFALLSSEDPNHTPSDRTKKESILDSLNTMSIDHPSTTTGTPALIERLTQPPTPGHRITSLLLDIGPACTQTTATLTSTLREITRGGVGSTNGANPKSMPLDEEAVARLIYFFSERVGKRREDGSAAVLGTLTGDYDVGDCKEWNLSVVESVIAASFSQLDWEVVAGKFDFEALYVKNTVQFVALLNLFEAGAKKPLPFEAVVSPWDNVSGHLSIIENALAVPPSVYSFPADKEEAADASTAGDVSTSACPNAQGWASTAVLELLLQLSDDLRLAKRVRDLFVKGLLSCPEVLLCALVRRLQTNAQGNGQNSSAGMQMKGELMRELIPLFFKQNPHHRVQNGPGAIRRLWSIAPNTVAAACIEAWRSTANETAQSRLATVVHVISIIRLLPSPESATAAILNGNKDNDFSIAVAFVMADNDMLQLRSWLSERVSVGGVIFLVGLVGYIGRNHASALLRISATNNNDGKGSPLLSVENLVLSLQFLQAQDASILGQDIPSLDSSTPATSMTIADSVKAVTEACLKAHPSISTALSRTASGSPMPSSQSVADDMANSYFQKIYTSEQSIDEVVDMLKRFKTSGNAQENEIFACMIHNLFDEYRFFSKYPEKELRITGILFGKLIQHQLVSSITLGIALRYVLEALRKPPSHPVSATTSNSGKMFRFGMFALEQFKVRLHEWPQYCSHIVQIPHLKEGYAALIEEIEGAMTENTNSAGGSVGVAPSDGNSIISERSGQGTMGSQGMGDVPSLVNIYPCAQPGANVNMTSQAQANGGVGMRIPANNIASLNPPIPPPKKTAVFGPMLGRAVNGKCDEIQHESPPDAILDRVQFLINNVTMSNVEQKAKDLREMLDSQYFGWLGHYLVVKRISTQPNFHSVYLAFLEQLGDYGKGLIEAILSSVYFNVGKLLRSPKITTSTSERSLLKNLGSWLGQITLARNRPILQITLDCKELLFQGYETGMLIAVTPFVAKIMEGAKNSIVFRPPNPWIMGLLSVFRALYGVDDLKMNIKFEVEVLCKNLGVKLEDIPLRTEDLAKRLPPSKIRNPDFNTKSSQQPVPGPGQNAPGPPTMVEGQEGKDAGITLPRMAIPGASLPVGSPSSSVASVQDQQQTVIPNLASYVTINPSLNLLFQQLASAGGSGNINNAMLKRNVPVAVDRAIREIIQPVVERSVTIACGTTKEIVTKDFAMESDENKMRKSAQLMVANLAGSLALVTCREPLRTSVSSHLRQLLVNNACGATNSGSNETPNPQLSDQERSVIDQCVSSCAQDNLELGCMLIEKAATEKAVRDMDEALAEALSTRKKHREQTGTPFYDMSIFGNGNQRYPSALPEPLRPKPGGLRSEQLLVYEAFQRIPRHPNVGASQQLSSGITPESSAGGISSGSNTGVSGKSGAKINIEALSSIAMKLNNAVTALLGAAGPRASEVTLRMLPPDHEVKQLLLASEQVTSSAVSNGVLSSSETDSILGFAQGIFKRLYELRLSEPLRLEAFVALLESLNKCCRQLGQDLGTWATYAPTETDSQRKLHRTVLLLLLRSDLLQVHELDDYLCKSIDNGVNRVWLEFTLVFMRTAILDKNVNPQKMPKVLNTLTKIGKGHSMANQIFQLLHLIQDMGEPTGSTNQIQEDVVTNIGGLNTLVSKQDRPTHQQSSSISVASLTNLAEATKRASEAIGAISRDDPQGFKRQVTLLLDGWMRMSNEIVPVEKTLKYVQLLQQNEIGKNEEQTERFFRMCTEIVVASVLKSATSSGTNSKTAERKVLNYTVIDSYGKLLSLLVKHMNSGGSNEVVATERVSLLNKILGITVRTMMAHYEHSKMESKGMPLNWDQRPWFRLLLVLVLDLNAPSALLDPISYGILSVFGSALHVVQPLVIPGFAFAWLELISHRMFLSNLLLLKGQKGWALAHQLLIDLFLFLEPHLRKTELTDAMRHLYKGTLRVLLVLLHDFPSFLAGYHLSFCNVIPENCVQLRNLVLSAFPRGMVLPDPFTPNLKIDLLPEISKSPAVLSNVAGPLNAIRNDLDNYLKNRQPEGFIDGLLPRLFKDDTKEIDAPRVNALVLYVGMQAIVNQQNSQVSQSLAHTAEMEVLKKLMELNDGGRYITLNAVANQLRYPSSHTHYYSCVMLFLFSEAKDEGVREQVTRVLLERLIVHRPHPWGLLITFIELIKNQRYQFWSHPFTRCATEIEKVFESVARSCMAPGSQRSTSLGGDVSQQQPAIS